MDIENLVVGDEVVLFLSASLNGDYYVCIGSAYCGLFHYDEAENSIFKVIDSEILMTSSYDSLKELVQITPDTSENLKTEARNAVPAVKDPTVVPKDPNYDQFKD